MKTASPLFTASLFIALTCPASSVHSADVPTPIRILWSGSSSIYYHNQPKVAAEWLTMCASLPAKSELVGRSGTGVHVYLRSEFRPEYGLNPGETILEKIAREKYDYVVLQIPAEFINGPEGDEHDRSLDVYCKAIRRAGGEPVFYEMGWGRDENAEVGRKKIFSAAVRNDVTLFAPCSSAWKRVRRERPDLDLHNPPDTSHPGTLGCYLNLCCFYAALTGAPPQHAPRTMDIWRRLNDNEKTALREKAKSVEFDEYDQALPSWMRRLVVGSRKATVPDDVADYLETVAWSEYRAFQRRLKRAQ